MTIMKRQTAARPLRHFAVRASAWAVAAASLALPSPASAYVRYRTSEGNPYSWRTTSVAITAYPQDVFNPQGVMTMTADQVANAATNAVGTWSNENPVLTSCSYLDLALTIAPTSQTAPPAQYDSKNIMVVRTSKWTAICSPGPASDPTPVCHQSGELALTTVFSRACGEVVDADVEVNADPTDTTPFSWGDLVSDPGGQADQDLQNALTHETGHFIGLDHTCYLPATVFPVDATGKTIIPVDNNGVPVPLCSAATDTEMHAVMYPSATPGDVSKRTLTPDDAQGICAIYPLGTTPVSCGDGNSTAGCSVAAGAVQPPVAGGEARRRGWLVAGLMAALAATIVGRRARRPRSAPRS